MMLYEDLFQEFSQLNFENKRDKLINILNELGDQYDFYAPTIETLQNPEVSEEYLDGLYEALMKPLSQFAEEDEQIAQARLLITQLNLSIKTDMKSNWEGVDELLNHISDL